MKIKNNSCSVIILAGGHSSRMGSPKSWLRINNDTFCNQIVSTYFNYGITDITVILNEKHATKEWEKELKMVSQKATIVINPYPNNGRLFSIYLGLKSVKNNSVFIHNVDHPFIDVEVLKQLENNINTAEVIIPSYLGKGGHPVLITENVINEISTNYQGYKSLKEALGFFTKKHIDVNSNSILNNINTPQHFEALINESV